MSKDPIPLTDAINRLKNASKSDIYVELEEFQKGKFKIPFTFIPLLVGTQAQGKLYEQYQDGRQEPENILMEQHLPTDNTNAFKAVPAGEKWEAMFVICEFVADATVIVRTCQFRYTPVLLSGVLTSLYLLTNTFNLSASEDAILILPAKNYHWQVLAGVQSIVADENPLPITAQVGGNFACNIAANKQVGDRTAITVFYKKVG